MAVFSFTNFLSDRLDKFYFIFIGKEIAELNQFLKVEEEFRDIQIPIVYCAFVQYESSVHEICKVVAPIENWIGK